VKHIYASILGSIQCLKRIGEGPIKVATFPHKKKKKKTLRCTAQLIDRSNNIGTPPPIKRVQNWPMLVTRGLGGTRQTDL